MNKTVIIINGAGGVGKDTICHVVAQHYKVKVISSIDPIKEIAQSGGWDYSDKSMAGRKLLSDLKLAFAAYNDLPNRYIVQEYENFLTDDNEILFVHIREGHEIDKFRKSVGIRCVSLLVTSDRVQAGHFGNVSDDDVEAYPYDFVYRNVKSEAELAEERGGACRELHGVFSSQHPGAVRGWSK